MSASIQEQVAQLNRRVALSYQSGEYERAMSIANEAHELAQIHLGPAHPALAVASNYLAVLNYSMGNFEQAERYLRKALETHYRVLEHGYPRYTPSLGNLAILRADLVRYEATGPIFERVIQNTLNLSEQQRESIAALEDLASLYEVSGSYDAALPLYEQALEMQRKVSGEQEVAAGLENLASLYRVSGNYDAAEHSYEQLLRSMKTQNDETGASHIMEDRRLVGYERLRTRSIAARERGEQGKAQRLLKQSSEIASQVSATRSPEPVSGTLVRYPNLECPARVSRGTRMYLFAQLLLEPPEPEAEAVRVDDDTHDPEESPVVEAVLRAPGFEIEGSNTKDIFVRENEDSDVRFSLIPRRSGEQEVRTDFYQHGRRIVTVRRNVMVEEEHEDRDLPLDPQQQGAPVAELRIQPTVAPPDLELTITLDRNDNRTMYFELHSLKEDLDYHHRRVGECRLTEAPEQKMHEIYDEMNKMARQLPSTADERERAEKRLANYGNDLWKELIPEPLQEHYWRFNSRVESVLVTSDEPWIPWEMVKPFRYDENNEREDADFWCAQFVMTRWLPGPGTADVLHAAITAGSPHRIQDLPSVQEEVAFVEQLSALHHSIKTLGRFTKALEVTDWVENYDFSILHFACHGLFDATVPNNSAIELADGALRPSDIQTRFGGNRRRPLIFINACHGARGGLASPDWGVGQNGS